jgi:hypothetical protein
MVPRSIAILCLLAVAGCAGHRSRPSAAGALNEVWLVGGWVLQGESCESDAGVIYKGDGSWTAYGTSGTWRIEDRKLVTRITAEGADNSEVTELETPDRIVEDVEIVGPNEFVSRRRGGSMRRLVRCPQAAQ